MKHNAPCMAWRLNLLGAPGPLPRALVLPWVERRRAARPRRCRPGVSSRPGTERSQSSSGASLHASMAQWEVFWKASGAC